jgi:hypothetical protein
VLVVWGRRFDPHHVTAIYRGVMRLNTVNATALGAYLLTRLALGGG